MWSDPEMRTVQEPANQHTDNQGQQDQYTKRRMKLPTRNQQIKRDRFRVADNKEETQNEKNHQYTQDTQRSKQAHCYLWFSPLMVITSDGRQDAGWVLPMAWKVTAILFIT
jgi:hypothetical protein